MPRYYKNLIKYINFISPFLTFINSFAIIRKDMVISATSKEVTVRQIAPGGYMPGV